MKKLLFLGIGSALIFTMGGVGPAQADNGPHISSAVTGATAVDTTVSASGCAGCHRVHTAKSADGMLLKTTDQKELCYTCHGTTGTGATTDVQGGVGYGVLTGQALRSGGFEKALINTDGGTSQYTPNLRPGHEGEFSTTQQKILVPAGTVGTTTTSSHSVAGTPQTIWGNGAISATAVPGKGGVNLECGSCHDPHGNKNYRILRPMPNDASYEITAAIPAVMDTTTTPPTVITPAVAAVTNTPVAIPDQPDKVYTTSDYWQTLAPGVPKISGKTGLALPATTVTPDGFIANISDWCLTCHTRYEGKSGAKSLDSGDAIFTYRHTTAKIDVNGTRNCITCHVAHGSNATMAYESSKVELPGGLAPSVGNASDSRLLRLDGRGVCLMCHNK